MCRPRERENAAIHYAKVVISNFTYNFIVPVALQVLAVHRYTFPHFEKYTDGNLGKLLHVGAVTVYECFIVARLGVRPSDSIAKFA